MNLTTKGHDDAESDGNAAIQTAAASDNGDDRQTDQVAELDVTEARGDVCAQVAVALLKAVVPACNGSGFSNLVPSLEWGGKKATRTS
jgi:hypothetical protein